MSIDSEKLCDAIDRHTDATNRIADALTGIAASLTATDANRLEAFQPSRPTPYTQPAKNYRWSPSFAEMVVTLNATGGLKYVAAQLKVTERSARRYVTRARDEGYTA